MQERPDKVTRPELAPVSGNFVLAGDVDVDNVLIGFTNQYCKSGR